MPLRVKLLPVSNCGHLKQVFTGFHVLSRLGLLELSYGNYGRRHLNISPQRHEHREAFCLGAEVEGVGLIVYDVHDSDVVVDRACDQSAIYFKRSFDASQHRHMAKVRPLGLNVSIDDRLGIAAAIRALRFGTGRTKYGDFLRAVGLRRFNAARESDLSAFPIASVEPKVLFLSRAFPPDGYYGVTPDETRNRISLNNMRAACIRQLRGAFGDRFIGGLLDDAYARSAYPDVVVRNSSVTVRKNYLRLVDTCDVCIATRGLLDSTGWKFAEYLAKGRAIVSEHMRFEATGNLREGQNYITFSTPEECVKGVHRLLADSAYRNGMMAENQRYFSAYVRPEALVMNSLATAIFESRWSAV
jgi:hypothetical protein